jgi:hypothetical protein
MRKTAIGILIFIGALTLYAVIRFWLWILLFIALYVAWKLWRKHRAKINAQREEARKQIEALSARADEGDDDYMHGGSGIPGFQWIGGQLQPVASEIERGHRPRHAK